MEPTGQARESVARVEGALSVEARAEERARDAELAQARFDKLEAAVGAVASGASPPPAQGALVPEPAEGQGRLDTLERTVLEMARAVANTPLKAVEEGAAVAAEVGAAVRGMEALQEQMVNHIDEQMHQSAEERERLTRIEYALGALQEQTGVPAQAADAVVLEDDSAGARLELAKLQDALVSNVSAEVAAAVAPVAGSALESAALTRLETKLEQVSSAVLSPRLSAAKAAAARIERAASSARGAGAAGDRDEPILSPQVLRATLANFQERVVGIAPGLRGALDGAAERRAAAAEGTVRAIPRRAASHRQRCGGSLASPPACSPRDGARLPACMQRADGPGAGRGRTFGGRCPHRSFSIYCWL